MDSTVCMRKNHYERLGLKLTASDQEIREGFGRAMSLPHLPEQLCQIEIAFDTLRNGVKRRAYDAALGLIPEPQPCVASSVISLRLSGHFGGLRTASLTQPKPRVETIAREQPIQRLCGPEDQLSKSTLENDGFAPEVPIPEFLVIGATRKRYTPVREQQVVDWKYPAFALGSVIVGVALIGAWAGAYAQETPQQARASTMMAAPRPAKGSPETLEMPLSSNSSAEPEFISPEVIERARQRIRARASAHHIADSGTRFESTAGEGAAAIGEHADALPVKLPLPSAVIVRTIERIGYACGGIASATAGEEPGVYKIACTSGESYQATPVHGRYHFRRW